MQIDFETLSAEFEECRFIFHYKKSSFFSSALIYKEKANLEDNILYITDADPRLFKNRIPKNIFLVVERLNKSYFDAFLKDYPDTNICMYETQKSAFTVLETIVTCIQHHHVWSDALHRAMLKPPAINELVNISGDFLGNSIIVIDSSMNLLGYTRHHNNTSKVLWHKVFNYAFEKLETGGTSFPVEADYCSNIKLHSVPDEDGKEISFLCSEIITDGYVTGHVIMFNDILPLTGYCASMMMFLQSFIELEFERSSSYALYPRNRYGVFLAGLLNAWTVPEKSTLKEYLNALDWHLKKYLHILVISSRNEQLSLKHQMDIEEYLQEIFDCTKTLLYENHVVILMESNTASPFSINTSARIVSFLKQNGLQIGISTAFNNIADIRKYYEQAVNALSMVEDSDLTLYHYTDNNMRYMIDTLSQTDDITAFCYPPLLELIRSDIEANTSYADTLFCFIMNVKSPSKTSRALYIHRNTLNYRLEKIAEMMNNNLNDPDVLFNIELSFKLLDYRPMNLDELSSEKE